MKTDIRTYGFRFLQIETQCACNMKCKFCAYPEHVKKKGSILSADVFHRIIDEVDPSLDELHLHRYSEPLLDKRIFEFIEIAQQKSFRVVLTTNGLLLQSPAIVEKLIKSRPYGMQISVQTISEKTFGARGIKSSFDSYITGIISFVRSARDSGIRIDMDIACNMKDSLLLRRGLGLEVGDPSVPSGLKEIESDLVNFTKRFHDSDLSPTSIEKSFQTYSIASDDGLKFNLYKDTWIKLKPFFDGCRLSHNYPVKTAACPAEHLGVCADGTVVPCCLAHDDILNLGNIHSDSLNTILERNKQFVDGIRGGSLPPICQICLGQPTRRGALLWEGRQRLRKFLGENQQA